MKVVGSRPSFGQTLHPFQRVDHARVAPGQLAGEQLAIVLDAEPLQQRLVHEMGARIRPVADPERHRRDALGLRLLDHFEERVRGELQAIRHAHAEVRHGLFVVVKLDGPGLQWQAIGLALIGPRLLRPRLHGCPIERREIEQEAVLHVLGLVRLGVEDVGRLVGPQCRLEARVESRLLVPGLLDLDAGVLGLELLDRLFHEGSLRHLGRPMAPERQFLDLLRARVPAQPMTNAEAAIRKREALGYARASSSLVKRHRQPGLIGCLIIQSAFGFCQAMGAPQSSSTSLIGEHPELGKAGYGPCSVRKSAVLHRHPHVRNRLAWLPACAGMTSPRKTCLDVEAPVRFPEGRGTHLRQRHAWNECIGTHCGTALDSAE